MICSYCRHDDCRICDHIPLAAKLGLAEAQRIAAAKDPWPATHAAVAQFDVLLQPIVSDPNARHCLAQIAAMEIDARRPQREAIAR